MLKIGSVVDGKYKILNIVGKGGMSFVYLAMNEKANKQWAIKEIRGQDYRNFEIDKQEIDMMKRLKHSGLPSIVDVIEQKESLLIVMDYIEGRSLEDLVLEYGPLSETQVLNYAEQICDVLHYLHSQNPPIIYRDMKPSNVMLRPDGKICLIDFGAAREYKPENRSDTVLLGTKGYAAPEQYRMDGQSDARTDIYSFGVTLFRLLTGETPEGLCRIQNLKPDLSAGLAHIVMKCLCVAKEERYQSALELLDDLSHYWEYDKEYQREQKRKTSLFLLSLFLSFCFGVAAMSCFILENSIRENNYMAYLQEAKTSVTKEAEIESYRKAIRLYPENEQAYQMLLQECCLEDEQLSTQESELFKEILMEYGENRETHEQRLRKNEPGYAKLCYEMGIACFYKYEDRNNKKYAGGYLEIAANSKSLNEKQRMRAERLSVISDYYSKIGVVDEAGDTRVSYKEYWKDLCAATEGNIVKEDNERTAIVMYEEMICQIISNAVRFQRAGVEKEELEQWISEIERHLQEDFKETDVERMNILEEELEGIRNNIGKAKRIVASVYREMK